MSSLIYKSLCYNFFNVLRLSLSFLCFIAFLSTPAQSTIYTADFTGEMGKGATGGPGNNTTIDLNGVDWSIDVSDANLGSNNWLRVVNVNGNELLEGRNTQGNAIWLSPVITITDFSDVTFSMDVSRNGNLNNNNSISIQYRINGNLWNIAENNGALSGNFGTSVASQNNLSGDTLEIRVIINTDGNNRRIRIDNINVTGTTPCTVFNLPFNEGFETSTFPPSCWNSYRGANGLGTQFDWTQTAVLANSGNNSAFVRFEVVTVGNAQDWLVTPAIDLGTAPARLSFFGREQFITDYNTEYSVRISTTSATDINSFSILQTYTETQMGRTFNQKTIDLSAYSGVVYIAFVMEQNDGDNWYLDDISIETIAPCSVPVDVSNPVAEFINNQIELQWNLSNCYDEMLVIASEGTPVSALPTGNGSGYTANAVFGDGSEITPNEFVIFKGIASEATLSNLLFGNTYHFAIFVRKGNNWSEGVPTSLTLEYCSVTGNITYDTSITLVNFGSINNVTAQGSGYDDFTAQSTAIRRGESETLTVNINTDGNFNVYSYAWIDWNQDGDFNDAGELYDLGNVTNTPDGPTSNSPLSITVPIDAALGDTRMRVLSQFYFFNIPNNGPCDGSTDGEIEDYTITVLPAEPFVYDNGWTPSNPEGIATIYNPIEIVAGNYTFTTNTNFESMTVAPGSNITVNNGVTLTTQNGIILQSVSDNFSGLILNGIIEGNVIYQRFTNVIGSGTTGGNDLIAPPLGGQAFGDFAANNTGILAASGNLRAWAPFNNNAGAYQNYNTIDNANTLLEVGKGHRAATINGQVLTFSGSVVMGNVVVNLSSPEGNLGKWNLIGNPYPSYVSLSDFLSHEVAPGITNLSLLDNVSGIYGYDGQALDGWDVVTLANAGNRLMAPGQGFFVAADAALVNDYNIEFTPDMRTVGSGDDFIPGRQAALIYLKLMASNGDQNYKTDIYFNANATPGLDPGYDAQTWGAQNTGFVLYSHLVADNEGVPIALQALGMEQLTEVSIPLGINATAGSTLVFSIAEAQLPLSTQVYLEDSATNTVTQINNSNFSITLDNEVNGTGRFFLRFTDNALSINDTSTKQLNIYQLQAEQSIVIAGQLADNTTAYLYDLQGRLVRVNALYAAQLEQRIDVNGLSSGVYLLSFDNGEQRISKRLILR